MAGELYRSKGVVQVPRADPRRGCGAALCLVSGRRVMSGAGVREICRTAGPGIDSGTDYYHPDMIVARRVN
ncbi:hypothetical protein [Streptomyces sp. NPDC004435]|uniref:hypothetical protein n=1 Tax=Streptomyces sp. NPDC004435 TaxID=3364701 RepID=UPI0036A11EE7